MNTPENAIYSAQAEWAKVRGLDWQPSKHGKPYARRLSGNLLEDLPDDVRAQFPTGTGSEFQSRMENPGYGPSRAGRGPIRICHGAILTGV